MEALLTDNDLIEVIVSNLLKGESHLSYSSLSQFKDSPKSFIEYKLKRKEQTDAMIYGAMVHCLVLEPEDFPNRYLAIDDTDICNNIGGAKPRATKQYKEWWADQEAQAGDRIIIEPQQYIHAKIVADQVRFNRASGWVLNQCFEREKPVEWEFKNFKFKGYVDGCSERVVFDLKTCADAETKKFQREIISMNYYLQAAMYLYALGGIRDYYIIAVDKLGGTSVHKLHPHLIEHGMNEYDKLLDKFNECILEDKWNESYDFWSDRFHGDFIAEKPGWLY
ncbi:MAG: PD-(D/E)XK nuclease-like domain-containing protein [Bacteroidetes bacterium]|nr:PD-(D/E)XK nuclease-like domain-containing protein [Bacteroidota bacterium]